MDRRSFIKLTAVSGTSAALASCGNPENQLVRFVPDEDIVPGVAVWKPSVCPLCSAGCGLTVRVMDADADVVRNGRSGVVRIMAAKKLEGSSEHPVNHGALCARGQSAIQITYHPDRLTQPLTRAGARGTGRFDAISWDAAIAAVAAKLDALEASGRRRALAVVSRPERSHRAALWAQFLARYGAPPPILHTFFDDEVLRRANAMSFGRAQLPTFDLANARAVISFGADFLGTWNSPVGHGVAYGAMRQGRAGIRGIFVQVEPRMSQTGASADQWIPARPGTEGALALGLAHVIVSSKLRPAEAAGAAGARIEGWTAGLPDYTPDRVEQMTGVSADAIDRLARLLVEARPAVAIVGGAPLAHTNGLFTALAVNALNALLGSVEQPGGVFFTPQFDVPSAVKGQTPSGPAESLHAFAERIRSGASMPEVLMIDGVNPIFAAPSAWKLRDAIEKIPFIVSFGGFLDETSTLADLILPDHSFLESWTDALPESGARSAVVSAAPPVMLPLHQTRATPDVLLDIGRRLKRPLELPWQTFEEMLGASMATLPTMTADVDTWSDVQEKGGWWGELPPAVRRAPDTTDTAGAATFSEPVFDGDPQHFPFHLLPYPSSAFLDGSLAHLPWLQEMPDPLTSAMWSSWVEINPSTAERLGIGQGDLVEIASTQGALRTAALISPGIAPDVLAMPIGQGHRSFTRYASGRGENPIEILAPIAEPATGSLAWAATRVRLSRVGAPDGRLILFAGGMREEHDQRR